MSLLPPNTITFHLSHPQSSSLPPFPAPSFAPISPAWVSTRCKDADTMAHGLDSSVTQGGPEEGARTAWGWQDGLGLL